MTVLIFLCNNLMVFIPVTERGKTDYFAKEAKLEGKFLTAKLMKQWRKIIK